MRRGADNAGMSREIPSEVPDADEVTALGAERVARMLRSQAESIDDLRRQVEWFKRQLFGRKSERFAPEPEAQQMHLGEMLGGPLPVPPEQADASAQVPAHKRRKPRSDFADETGAVSFFDDKKVPVETIELPAPQAKGLAPDQYKVIGEKTSFRLAQRPGTYVVLKYVRPIVELHDTQALHCAPAPTGSSKAAAPT